MLFCHSFAESLFLEIPLLSLGKSPITSSIEIVVFFFRTPGGELQRSDLIPKIITLCRDCGIPYSSERITKSLGSNSSRFSLCSVESENNLYDKSLPVF